MIDYETLWMLRLAKFAEKGTFPVAGGVLDQCPAFLEAMELIRLERASYGAD